MRGNLIRSFVAVLALGIFSATPVVAAPPNAAVLDGRPNEYDPSELRGTNTFGVGNFGGDNAVSNLFVTWNSNYLFLALQGDAATPNNKLTLLLDVDPGNNTGASSVTNWAANTVSNDYLRYNDAGWAASTGLAARAFGLDYMVASEGTYHNVIRILYDGEAAPTTNNTASVFDSGNGATPTGGEVDMVALSESTACTLEGMEARIPWSVLFPAALSNRFGVTGDNPVPTGAVLRILALIHNNTPNDAFSASNTIPIQSSVLSAYVNGVLVSDDYVDVGLDGDSNGLPDMAVGDVNAPYVKSVAGIAGGSQVYALFNEDVTQVSVENAANWLVGGAVPSAVSQAAPNAALLTLSSPLPAAGTLVSVVASNVQDSSANHKITEACLFPAASGLSNSLTVRFVLNKASGMGLAPISATNFFINGSAVPLEWGYPPSQTQPLTASLPGCSDCVYKDIVFPPGTASELSYKYSAIPAATGTNSYEIVRLDNWSTMARTLTLSNGAAMMVVTDYLGAVGAPYRDPAGTNTYDLIYQDPQRGDAGTRSRRTVLFQLNLSARDTNAFDRVLIQGTDPLRGFNSSDIQSDWAGNVTVGWDVGGLTLVDDGTLGDTVAGDGIYSRQWVLSGSGLDAEFEPGSPNSLVGGNNIDPTLPFGGNFWASQRTPLSFKYKFYVVKDPAGTPVYYENPGSDIEVYLQGPETNLVMAPFVWSNENVPFKPASNRAEVLSMRITNGQVHLIFTNISDAFQHQVEVGENQNLPWRNYGTQIAGVPSLWTARVQEAKANFQMIRLVTEAPKSARRNSFTPNPIPTNGGNVTFFFNQNGTALAGSQSVNWFGSFPGGGFTNVIPMEFDANGTWVVDITVPPSTTALAFVDYIFVNDAMNTYVQPAPAVNFKATMHPAATWSPENPLPGQDVTFTYNANGRNLAGQTSVYFHIGFDGWQGVLGIPMTNTAETNVWIGTVTVPSNRTSTVNWVFRNSQQSVWDNNSNNDWHLFIDPL